MSALRDHLDQCQSDALLLQSLLGTISVCLCDPRREELLDTLAAEAMRVSAELHKALDRVNVPSE